MNDDNFLWVPQRHGEKDPHHFAILLADGKPGTETFSSTPKTWLGLQPIMAYDQEPLSTAAFDTYRVRMMLNVKIDQQAKIFDAPVGVSAAMIMRSGRFPIWCHSEENSDEIRSLEQSLFATCYYWYHAFISRDYFRHMQYLYRLIPRDKSKTTYRFLLYAQDTTGSRQYRSQMIDRLSPIKHQIYFDWDGNKKANPNLSASICFDDAETCGIHLVAETLFDTTKIHLTEKVFKPMVMSQPFILWSAPGSLAYLRKYGFETFDSVWSESYDLEPDSDRRMEMLIDLTNKLSCLSQAEYQRIYEKCLPIVEHNRKRFFSQDFIDFCWHELESNFHTAFEISREFDQRYPGGQALNVILSNRDLYDIPILAATVDNVFVSMDGPTRRKILERYSWFSGV